MNSLSRIMAAIRFERTDRVPVIAQVFGHAAVACGVALGDYLRDGETLARCQLAALRRYGYDAVFALMDVSIETEALGSRLIYRAEHYPCVAEYAVSAGRRVCDLRPPDPGRDGRMPELLKAARILRHELGDETLVVGCVLGPLTLATQLLGAEAALFLAIDEPADFSDLLNFATDTLIRFGVAQIEAGVHLPVVFNPSASPAVVPAAFFREFEAPCLARMFAAFSQAGACANWLHIAGPVEPILPMYAGLGVDIANFDYCLTPAAALSAAPRLCLEGNLRSLAFMDGSPGDIKASGAALIRDFAARGGFILSSGCEIPPESKPDNVAALVAAAGS